MSLTTIGAGLELANTIAQFFAPTISQEQKESLLDAFKSRVSEVQSAVAAVAADPTDRVKQLALRDLVTGLCNAAGYPALGLAGYADAIPLDVVAALACCAALAVFALESGQANPVKAPPSP